MTPASRWSSATCEAKAFFPDFVSDSQVWTRDDIVAFRIDTLERLRELYRAAKQRGLRIPLPPVDSPDEIDHLILG